MKRLLLLPTVLIATGCGVATDAALPRCDAIERVGLVAQSVPTAVYVPCIRELPPGWQVTDVQIRSGSTSVTLQSDRADGRPVDVVLAASCDPAGASPVTARVSGVRSSLRLRTVEPSFAGVSYDVFRGGCVTTSFSFSTGPHIPLMEDLSTAVHLMQRRELAAQLQERLGVELDP